MGVARGGGELGEKGEEMEKHRVATHRIVTGWKLQPRNTANNIAITISRVRWEISQGRDGYFVSSINAYPPMLSIRKSYEIILNIHWHKKKSKHN